MAVYIVTGKLGGGKSLASVGRLKTYLEQGRKVATNLDLNMEHLLPAKNKNTVLRIPHKPRLQDFEFIGYGDDDPLNKDESKYGCLVMDELGSWFNTRDFRDKERPKLLEWLLHSRKYHWDIFLIVQDIDLLDNQLKKSLGEHLVSCKRTDRMNIPVIGFLFKALTGKKMPIPRMHMAIVRYGVRDSAAIVDRWWYRGSEIQNGYDTNQKFSDDVMYWFKDGEPQETDMRAPYTLLSAWHLKGRYKTNKRPFFLRLSNLLLNKIVSFAAPRSRSSEKKRIKSYLVRTVSDGSRPSVGVTIPWFLQPQAD